jgi:hypothetical protein
MACQFIFSHGLQYIYQGTLICWLLVLVRVFTSMLICIGKQTSFQCLYIYEFVGKQSLYRTNSALHIYSDMSYSPRGKDPNL